MAARQQFPAPGQGLVLALTPFAAHGVRHTRGLHKAALVGGVDEHPSAELGAVGGFQRAEAARLFDHGSQPLPEPHRHLCLAQPRAQCLLRDVRFKRAGHVLTIVLTHPPEEIE
jgi:hypothetical protein